MLAYAYDFLDWEHYESLNYEKFENVFELFAIILLKGTFSQIKRGLYKEYREVNDNITCIRGKLNITQTIYISSKNPRFVNCDFEEYTEDNIYNQIIKTTLYFLKNKIDSVDIRMNIQKCLNYFQNVSIINLNYNLDWKGIYYHHNNKTYKMLIDVCYLIYDRLLINEEEGQKLFPYDISEKKMAKLYEQFIYKFYKRELKNVVVKYQQNFKFKDIQGDILDILPSMYTDITLQRNKKMIIIDTKFYKETLTKNRFSINETLRNSHISQILTYIYNSPFIGNIEGMLLYPTVDFELSKQGTIQGKKIYIETINLNEDFLLIKSKLLRIALQCFENEPIH